MSKNSSSPVHSMAQPDMKISIFCCCLGKSHKGDIINERPLQANEENRLPTASTEGMANSKNRPSSKENVATVYDLPPGWRAVESRSRPDRTAYMNEFTGERISWVPTEPASTIKGEIRRSKRKSRANNDRESVQSSESENTVRRTSFDRRLSS